MTKSTHHSLIEIDGKWSCALCTLPAINCEFSPECAGEPVSVYQDAKWRKADAKRDMDAMQSEMDNFIDRLFK